MTLNVGLGAGSVVGALVVDSRRRPAGTSDRPRASARRRHGMSGQRKPAAVEALIEQAHAHEQSAEYGDAERRFAEAVTAARGLEAVEPPDRLLVGALEGVGNLHRIQGRYTEAERLLREALAIAEDRLGDDDLQVAGVLNALAITFKYSGRFDDAAELYRRAPAIIESPLGDEHPDVASVLHNLGGLPHAGPEHIDVAADRAAVAAILDGLGRHEEAQALLLDALAVFERELGRDHYEVAVTLNNLAAIDHRTGNPARADALYRRALKIKQQLLGDDHPDVAVTLNNHAALLIEQERYHAAEPLAPASARHLRGRARPDPPELRDLPRKPLSSTRDGSEATWRLSRRARSVIARRLLSLSRTNRATRGAGGSRCGRRASVSPPAALAPALAQSPHELSLTHGG